MPVVTVVWQPPGDGEARTVTLSVANFDQLSKRGRTSELLEGAPRQR